MAAEHAEHGPLDQFTVAPMFELPTVAGVNLSLTNSGFVMIAVVFATILLFTYAMRARAVVPGRMQSLAELTYQFVHTIVDENAGHAGMRYFPFFFSLFLFIFMVNFAGLIPYSFAPTAQISTTFAMGAVVFIGITIIGFIHKGPIGFFKHFLPSGLPVFILPLIFFIELISYCSRPFSLAIRLAANMTAGHTLMHVIAGFVAPLMIGGVLPIAFLVFMMGFESFVSFLQAYVFTMLSCMYLGEALADDHH